MATANVCLVGAGYIADVHAEALRDLPDVKLAAVVDTDIARARAFAARWKVPAAYGSLDDALAAGGFERAHVLVPPDAHETATQPLLAAGKAVLVEKPLATTRAACERLIALAAEKGVPLGVNQNYVHHPSVRHLERIVLRRRYGRLIALHVLYSMPLRQLQSRQFGHWMFREPLNILLEQAVHPLSIIAALTGGVVRASALSLPPVEVAPGVPFYATTSVSIEGRLAPAQLHFSVGGAFPVHRITAVCDDGLLVVDVNDNRMVAHSRTRWLGPVDAWLSGTFTALDLAGESARGLGAYALALARVKRRSDPFFLSMKAGIAAFHGAVDRSEQPRPDGAFGLSLVGLCQDIAAACFQKSSAPAPIAPAEKAEGADVVVLGGTGFIGQATVDRLVKDGRKVAVVARNLQNLPPVFTHPNVRLVQGDVRRADDVERAVAGVPVVVNLAHGGGGGSWTEIERALVGSARTVAEACLKHGAKRLIHVGSIASLYLGDAGARVTGATPADTESDKRADYARAKAEADRALIMLHRTRRLPVVILRPGVVVGEGSSPFHSALGAFNADQHCLGWNRGRNPLPFVLVEDVADAIARAVDASGIEGRSYNLVGDVRIGAADYVAQVAQALERPLRYHPGFVATLYAEEAFKWLVKRAAGRKGPPPNLRDLRSRGLVASFDTTDAKTDLGWQPVADRERFLARAVRVHAPSGQAR